MTRRQGVPALHGSEEPQDGRSRVAGTFSHSGRLAARPDCRSGCRTIRPLNDREVPPRANKPDAEATLATHEAALCGPERAQDWRLQVPSRVLWSLKVPLIGRRNGGALQAVRSS